MRQKLCAEIRAVTPIAGYATGDEYQAVWFLAEQLSKGKRDTAISHSPLISNFKKVAYERGLE